MTTISIANKVVVSSRVVLGFTKHFDNGQYPVEPNDGRHCFSVILAVNSPSNTVLLRFPTETARDRAYDKALSDLGDLPDF